MKKIFNLWSLMVFSIASVVCAGFTSCSSNDVEEPQKEVTKEAKDVQVYFVYTLDTSNGTSMTRAEGDDVFNKFYEKISTGEMVPDGYEITLTEITTGASYTFNGKWDSSDLTTIRTGKYKVSGSSKAGEGHIQEMCSLLFDEEIEITPSSKEVKLTAKYDCFLLVFTDTNIVSLLNNYIVNLKSATIIQYTIKGRFMSR